MIIARAASKSDPGRKRRRNEDSYVCEPPLFAVADGMGGAQAGEVASQLAASALREGNGDGDGEKSVVALIQEANRRVWQRANEDAAASGMGTTITVALAEPTRVVFGHVGDSRAYLLRESELIQLTEDHSLVAELVRRGELSPKEAETHPQRSVITRALGTDPDVDVDTFAVETQPQDLFLICSDGLSSMVDDETVREVLEHHRDDLDAAAKALVAAANRGGGEDNITAVLFEVAAGDDVGGDTTPMAAVEEPEEPKPVHDEDEDTLTGIESPAAAPAAVDTIVVPPEDAALLAAPPESARPTLARRLLVLLVIVTLVLVIAALILWGLAR
ncbi:MAG: Stp1/IreP family PP2C-type Ser/Thr phosphatase [Gaiellaceae bacterium]